MCRFQGAKDTLTFSACCLKCFSFVWLTGQIFLPPHEVPVLLLAGRVRGQLDCLRRVLVLHRAVSWTRVQKFNRECLICPRGTLQPCCRSPVIPSLSPSVTNTGGGSSTARPAAACVRKEICTWGSASLPNPKARSGAASTHSSRSSCVSHLVFAHFSGVRWRLGRPGGCD